VAGDVRPAPSVDRTTLDQLHRGQSAIVLDVVGDDAIATRLLEMGLIEGERVTLLGVAPLGDPLEYLVRSYRLSLRRSEARRVQIELRQSDAPAPSPGSSSGSTESAR
jgi:ferrous iron transport protein A